MFHRPATFIFQQASSLWISIGAALLWCLLCPGGLQAQATEQGFLFVYPEPRDVKITIPGLDTKYVPGLALQPGRYEVRVSKFGYRDATEEVFIEADKSLDLFVELKRKEQVHDPATGMTFVWIPNDCFQMGCGPWAEDCDADESPARKVCLPGFWMGRYEVTQKEWNQVMDSNPSQFQTGENYPVEQVLWTQARAFAGKIMQEQEAVTARLPSEAQWEYAARSEGREEAFAGGDNPESLAWYRNNSGGSTHPVGEKQPNALGLFDMSGNVWEWCRDAYDAEAYEHNQTVSRENVLFRVRRGGSWQSPRHKIRCLYRGRYPPDLDFESNGLRLVLEPRKDSASKSSP